MKVKLKYCFLDRIKDLKENFGPLKIIRNNRLWYTQVNLPLWTTIDLAMNPSFPAWFFMLCAQYGIVIGAEWIAGLLVKRDMYRERAKSDLFVTLQCLRGLGVNTDYEFLLDSYAYESKYHFTFNMKKLPILLESKYIMVPSYGFDGDVKETSVLQEHVVGSKNYVLSLESPKREFRPVPIRANL